MTKSNDKKDQEFHSVVKLAKLLAKKTKNKTDEKYMIIMIRNAIFSLPSVYTGLISEEALELPYDKRTKEHFYGRTESAKRLVHEIKTNPKRSEKALILFLKSRSRVHKVTAKQNNLLKQYNKKNPGIHWRKAYKDCGIDLLKQDINTKNGKRYAYFIGSTEYKSIADVAEDYGISISGASYRFFKSVSHNHSHWKAELIS
jgi:hypothetical protein